MKLPITFFWPGKVVPAWLCRIEFSGKSNGVPSVEHSGFGIIAKRKGRYFAWIAAQAFIRINGAGMAVKMTGQGDGVCCSPRLIDCIRSAMSTTQSEKGGE